VSWKWVFYTIIYTHHTYTCSEPCLIFSKVALVTCGNYFKIVVNVPLKQQLWITTRYKCNHVACSHFHHPLWNTFVTRFLLWFPLIHLVQPLAHHYWSTIIQLYYDYNTITYNLIKIHSHRLSISSSNVFHFERFKMLWECYLKVKK